MLPFVWDTCTREILYVDEVFQLFLEPFLPKTKFLGHSCPLFLSLCF